MTIYRCLACSFIGEHTAAAGAQAVCAKCATANKLFDTPFYVQKLVERYLATRRELDAFKAAVADPENEASPAIEAAPAAASLTAAELANTVALATEAQHQPLREWFAVRRIEATFVLQAVDTTGYFDEAAREIAAHYEPLAALLERIRFAYRKEFSWINMDLSDRTEEVLQGILSFCRQLYGYTLFSRYSFKKQDRNLGLGIQRATVVRNFFMGTWLEWHALGTLLELCVERKRDFSCARNALLSQQDGAIRELDVAVLLAGRTLVVIECKTGEFRAELDKYTRLRQRLGVDRTQFIICNPDLPDEQLAGLGAMHGLTFVNLKTLRPHLECLV